MKSSGLLPKLSSSSPKAEKCSRLKGPDGPTKEES